MLRSLLLLLLASLPLCAEEGMDVGQHHPDFLLPRLDGTLGRLTDHIGKKLLVLHFASW